MPRLRKMQVHIDEKFILGFDNSEIGKIDKPFRRKLLHSMHNHGKGDAHGVGEKGKGRAIQARPSEYHTFLVFAGAFLGRPGFFLGASCVSTRGWALASFRAKQVRAGM